MDNFCSKCGAQMVDGMCPNCSQTAETPEAAQPAPEIIEEPKSAPAPEPPKAPTAPPIQQYVPVEQPQPPAAENFTQPDMEAQPSKFYYTFKQTGNIFKHFFSKHTVDAIAAQFNEDLHVWLILMPFFAVISAVSMTLSFDGSRGLSIGAGSIFTEMKLSYLEVFIISFAMSLAAELVYSIAVMVFLRSFKIQTNFKAAANLTMSAYIAVVLIDMLNILTIGMLKSESIALSGFGMIAFIVLLYNGIIRVTGGKKPFWSFFLMLTCAAVIALVAALVICCPIIVMRGLQELAGAVKWN